MSRDRDRPRFAIVTDSPRMVRTMVDGVEDHRLAAWYNVAVWVASEQKWRIVASFERQKDAAACAAAVDAAVDAAVAEAARARVAAAQAAARSNGSDLEPL